MRTLTQTGQTFHNVVSSFLSVRLADRPSISRSDLPSGNPSGSHSIHLVCCDTLSDRPAGRPSCMFCFLPSTVLSLLRPSIRPASLPASPSHHLTLWPTAVPARFCVSFISANARPISPTLRRPIPRFVFLSFTRSYSRSSARPRLPPFGLCSVSIFHAISQTVLRTLDPLCFLLSGQQANLVTARSHYRIVAKCQPLQKRH